MNTTFSWIPFYEELADKLFEYKERRKELHEIIKRLSEKNELMDYLHFDRPDYWTKPNTEIDPFSIFAIFNRSITDENRIIIAQQLAEEFKVNAALPKDFDGIPRVNNMNSFFIGNIEMWDLFIEAMKSDKTIGYTDKFSSLLDAAISVKWHGQAMVTMALFWIRPYSFISIDGQNKSFFLDAKNNMQTVVDIFSEMAKNKIVSGENYIKICEECKKLCETGKYKFKDFPEMSRYAYLWGDKPYAYFLGAYNDKEGIDNSQEFIKKGIWHNGFSDKYIEEVKKIQIGDRIAIKSVSTKKHHLPFDYDGEHVAIMLIKAVGRVTKNYGDGRTLDVVWTEFETPKIWYFFTFLKTFWRVDGKSKDWRAKALIDFAFEDKEQDYEKFIENTMFIESEKFKYWLFGYSKTNWAVLLKDNYISFSWDELGDFSNYNTKDNLKKAMQDIYGEQYSYKNAGHALWQFANEMKIGDIVFAKDGTGNIVARGIVTSDYIFEDTRNSFKSIRKINWTHKGSWEHPGYPAAKILTEITKYTEYCDKLNALFPEEEIAPPLQPKYSKYTAADFLNDVFISEEQYNTMTAVLNRKKNIILQGAPGVGKTYAAKRLAYSIMGEKDESRVMTVQFHQSYSYEDFIMGYKPEADGFKISEGCFYRFCKTAETDDDNDYFFIIDEINRGNLSKIFGELFMLLEADKRGEEVELLYRNEKFSVPENIHIIGMMNTADRSLAMLDYALRRRFAFFEMQPAFDSNGFKELLQVANNVKFNNLIDQMKKLNQDIETDASLGAGFRIGHSYFISNQGEEIDNIWLKTVVDFEIIPLLQEYWFDDSLKSEGWKAKLLGAIDEN